jgi:hypothetical protein
VTTSRSGHNLFLKKIILEKAVVSITYIITIKKEIKLGETSGPPHEKVKDEYWLIEGLIKEFAMLIASRIAAIASIQATFKSNVAWMKRSVIREVMSIANSLNFMRWLWGKHPLFHTSIYSSFKESRTAS